MLIHKKINCKLLLFSKKIVNKYNNNNNNLDAYIQQME